MAFRFYRKRRIRRRSGLRRLRRRFLARRRRFLRKRLRRIGYRM